MLFVHYNDVMIFSEVRMLKQITFCCAVALATAGTMFKRTFQEGDIEEVKTFLIVTSVHTFFITQKRILILIKD